MSSPTNTFHIKMSANQKLVVGVISSFSKEYLVDCCDFIVLFCVRVLFSLLLLGLFIRLNTSISHFRIYLLVLCVVRILTLTYNKNNEINWSNNYICRLFHVFVPSVRYAKVQFQIPFDSLACVSITVHANPFYPRKLYQLSQYNSFTQKLFIRKWKGKKETENIICTSINLRLGEMSEVYLSCIYLRDENDWQCANVSFLVNHNALDAEIKLD